MIDVILEDSRWADTALDALAQRAVTATLAAQGLDATATDVAVLGCDDARIAELNADFRDKSSPTNVLSWPETDLGADSDGAEPETPVPDVDGTLALGDIAIAYDTCVREAADQNKAMADHVTHLIVHATLHLLGYDHIRDRDASRMEALEVKILGNLGIADPY